MIPVGGERHSLRSVQRDLKQRREQIETFCKVALPYMQGHEKRIWSLTHWGINWKKKRKKERKKKQNKRVHWV